MNNHHSNDLCSLCGKRYGLHSYTDDRCPTPDLDGWTENTFRLKVDPVPAYANSTQYNPRLPEGLRAQLCARCGYDITLHSQRGHVCPGTLHDAITAETVFTQGSPDITIIGLCNPGSFSDTDRTEKSVEHDPVNHPKHYTEHPSGIECIQITEHMGFNLGNATKYIWRSDLKGNAVEDLEKAAWYIAREIAKRKKESGAA